MFRHGHFSKRLQPHLHDVDLLFLGDDDFLGQPAQRRVLPVQQVRLGHVDGALVVRDHHGGEIVIGIAGHGRGHHVVVHLRHALHHRLPEVRRLAGITGSRSELPGFGFGAIVSPQPGESEHMNGTEGDKSLDL